LSACSKNFTVSLTERTPLDPGSPYLLGSTGIPPEGYIYPERDSVQERFFLTDMQLDSSQNGKVMMMTVPGGNGEHIYIDRNNDMDLTNDGEPFFFPFAENELDVFVHVGGDPQRRVGIKLCRLPRYTTKEGGAAAIQTLVDSDGNLQPAIVGNLGSAFPEDFEGSKGTFYFTEEVIMARGRLTLSGNELNLGIVDLNRNGLFNDEKIPLKPNRSDLLLLDLNGDGTLNMTSSGEVLKLYDVFELDGTRYKLTEIDPYGQYVKMRVKNEAPTDFFVQEKEEWETRFKEKVRRKEVPESIFDLVFHSIDDETISLSNLRGEYILLNFWGEWCAPCIEEIPVLVDVHESSEFDTIVIIGMLLTYDLDEARDMMVSHRISWPQVLLTEEIREMFNVLTYPTNILILPNGQSYLKTGIVDDIFFEHNVR